MRPLTSRVAVVAMIPLLNVINVLVLARFASGSPPGAGRIALDLAKNPLIWSTALGLVLNVAGVPLPRFADSTLQILGAAMGRFSQLPSELSQLLDHAPGVGLLRIRHVALRRRKDHAGR